VTTKLGARRPRTKRITRDGERLDNTFIFNIHESKEHGHQRSHSHPPLTMSGCGGVSVCMHLGGVKSAQCQRMNTKWGDHVDHQPMRAWPWHGTRTNAKTLICKISKGHRDQSSPSRPPLGRGGRCAWVLKVRDQSACESAERKKTRQDDLARATTSGGLH
jgi:hypothetical protein